jgi:hypothetical protein
VTRPLRFAVLALTVAAPACAQHGSTVILTSPAAVTSTSGHQGLGGQGWLVLPPPGQQPSTVILPANPAAC